LDVLEARGALPPTTEPYRAQAITLRFEPDPELVAATVPPNRNTISLWRTGDRPLLLPSVSTPSRTLPWLAGALVCVGLGLALLATFALGRAGSLPAETMRASVNAPPRQPVVAHETATLASTPAVAIPTPEVIDVPVVTASAPAPQNRATQRPTTPPKSAALGNDETVEVANHRAPAVPPVEDKGSEPVPQIDPHELSARATAAIETSLE
jgi:hypothetical protein